VAEDEKYLSLLLLKLQSFVLHAVGGDDVHALAPRPLATPILAGLAAVGRYLRRAAAARREVMVKTSRGYRVSFGCDAVLMHT
jgi:hypothetical protein